jgi:hypothetical protein
MDLSPENMEKLDKCNELIAQVTKRMDGMFSRRAKRDADKAQRRADRAKRDADEIDPVEAALRAANPLSASIGDEHLASERSELRQGGLSKRNI